MAQEAVKWINGDAILAGKSIVYNGQALTLHRSELTRNPRCDVTHVAYKDVYELMEKTASLTPQQIFAKVRSKAKKKNISLRDKLILELDRDLLLKLECSNCSYAQQVNRLLGLVSEKEQKCPQCGQFRRSEVLHNVGEDSPYIDTPLAKLGVPPGDIVTVHDSSNLFYFELTADLIN
jgi:hypothetical protein